MKRMAIAAVGLALVVSSVVGGVVGSRFGASASPDPPNPGHDWSAIGLPEGTWPDLDADKVDGLEADYLMSPRGGRLVDLTLTPDGVGGHYSQLVDVSDCNAVTIMAHRGDLNTITNASPDGVTRVEVLLAGTYKGGGVDGAMTATIHNAPVALPFLQARLSNTSGGPSAWLWCAW